MTAHTTTGTQARTFAYAWAATSPAPHWTRRATPHAARRAVGVHGDDEVAGPHGALAHLAPFRSRTMSAAWQGRTYVVRSYRTPIVKVHLEDGAEALVEVNDTTYSVATSHDQEVAGEWAGYAVESLHPSR